MGIAGLFLAMLAVGVALQRQEVTRAAPSTLSVPLSTSASGGSVSNSSTTQAAALPTLPSFQTTENVLQSVIGADTSFLNANVVTGMSPEGLNAVCGKL